MAAWRKNSLSSPDGSKCVEVVPLPGVVAVRDGKDPGGPALVFTHATWRSFTAAIKEP